MWRLILRITWPWLACSFCFCCHYWCKPAKWSFSSSVVLKYREQQDEFSFVTFSSLICRRLHRSYTSMFVLGLNPFPVLFHKRPPSCISPWLLSLFCFLPVVLPTCVQKANHWQHNYSVLLWGSASQSLCFMNNSSWFSPVVCSQFYFVPAPKMWCLLAYRLTVCDLWPKLKFSFTSGRFKWRWQRMEQHVGLF